MKYPCYRVRLFNDEKVDKIVDADYNIVYYWDLKLGWYEWQDPSSKRNLGKTLREEDFWRIIETFETEEDLMLELI